MDSTIHTLPLVLILILLPATGIVIGSVEGEEDPEPQQGLTDYPQQDGGSDDRLFKYRSMWTDGYQIVNKSEIKELVRYARDHNFNCISPNINGHSLGVFYNSTYAPKYIEVKWSFDPLMELIKEAHKYDISVMPWFHTLYAYPTNLENPSWRDRSSGGSYSWAWMDPTNQEVRNHLQNLTRELFKNYPLDGIKLDTIRYGGSTYGYTDNSIQKYYDEGWTDFGDFRRNQITEVVELIYETVMDIRPYSWVGADIWHSYSSWYYNVFQDSRTWAQMGIIDFVTTMSYTTSKSSFASNLEDNIKNFACPVVAGPYVYVPGNTAHGSVPTEEVGIDLLINQTETAQRMGALGTCNFAFKFLRDWPSYARALRDGPFKDKALCPLKKQTTPVRSTKWDFDKDQDTEGWRTVDMGNFYPFDGVWSISNCKAPKLMSPLMNITSEGINVMEISFRTEATDGRLNIYWSHIKTMFSEDRKIVIPVKDDKDWNLYSIHLEDHELWTGRVKYVRVVPEFSEPSNITIDLIHLTWMPYCVRNWSYLGPFYTGMSDGLLDRQFIDDESDPRPRLSDVSGGREWTAFGMERDQVDLRFPLGHLHDAVTYAHVYVRSDVEGPAELRIGNSDGSRVFFNGLEVYRNDDPRRVAPDQDISYIDLKRGINTILIKLAVYTNENSFFIRLTDIGNTTMEGLEYFEELPLIPSPGFIDPPDGWISTDTVTIGWSIPVGTLGLDHFVWVLDGNATGISRGNQISLSGLSDGIHDLIVHAVDDMGFSGEENSTEIKVDTEHPHIQMLSEPPSRVTSGVLEWEWIVLDVPISGMDRYEINVERWRSGSSHVDHIVKDEPFHGTRYTLFEGVLDSCLYRIEVSAFSGSGLYHTIRSEYPCLVDLTPPGPPTSLDLVHLAPGSRKYDLGWYEPLENTHEGISHYEVWSMVDDGVWSMFVTTADDSIVIERPLGYVLSFKVRAIDLSGHVGSFSSVVVTDNVAPDPTIEVPSTIPGGRPFPVSCGDLDDIDGEIVLIEWTLDGVLVSDQCEFQLTLSPGQYLLRMSQVDDLGLTGFEEVYLDILSDDPYLNATLTDELISSSVVDVDLPPVTNVHYNNRTVVVINTTGDDDPVSAFEVLFSATLVLTGSVLGVILLLGLASIVLKEGRNASIRSTLGPDDGGNVRRRRVVSESSGSSLDLDRLRLDKLKMSEALRGRSVVGSMKAAPSADMLPGRHPVQRAEPLPSPSGQGKETFEGIEEWDVEFYDEFEEVVP